MNLSIRRLGQKRDKKPQLQKIVFKEIPILSKSKTTFRFFKNKNIVEANKQNIESVRNQAIERESIDRQRKAILRQSMNSFKRTSTVQRETIRNSQRLSFVPPEQDNKIFSPRIKRQIFQRHQDYRKTHNGSTLKIDTGINNIFYQDKLGLQKLLKKNKIYGQRCLVGMNIPKIQEKYTFSRFELFNLYTYYKTLLKSTNKSVKEFKKGFQSILYMNKIDLNSEMIDKMCEAFFEEITFHNFIKTYGNIQNLLFTQTIIQYLISVFSQFYREEELSWDRVYETLKQKMQEGEAMEIRSIMFEHYGRKQDESIQLKEILQACHENIAICKKVFNTMSKNPIPSTASNKKQD